MKTLSQYLNLILRVSMYLLTTMYIFFFIYVIVSNEISTENNSCKLMFSLIYININVNNLKTI